MGGRSAEDRTNDILAQTRQYARLLDTVLSNTVDQIYLVDRRGCCVYANKTAARALGREPADLVGKTWRQLGLDPAVMDEVERRREDVFAAGAPVTAESTCSTPRGRRAFEYVLSPVHGPTGSVEAVVVTVHDISKRQRLVEEREVLLEKERLARTAAEAASRQRDRLLNVVAALAAALTPDRVAEVIVTEGIAALGASAGAVALLNQSRDTLTLVGTIGYPSEAIAAWRTLSIDSPLPLTEAARTGQAIWIDSPEVLAARYPSLTPDHRMTASKAWAAAPLVGREGVIGAFALSFTESHVLNSDERQFVMILAHQCALALDRARLYADQRQALADAERQRDFVQQILDNTPICVGVLEGPNFVVTLVNPATIKLSGIPREQWLGRPLDEIPVKAMPVNLRLAELAYQTGQVRRAQNLALRLPSGRTIYVDIIVAPLPGEAGRPRGVIFLAQDVTGRRQIEEERDHLLARDRAVAEIAQALVHELELSRVIDVVIDQSMRVLGVDYVAIWLADSAHRELVLFATRGLLPGFAEQKRRLSFDSQHRAAMAARTRDIQVVTDVQAPDVTPEEREFYRQQHVKSLLAVPLIARGRLVGVAGIGTSTARQFTASDLKFNATIADLFAVAIENGWLYDEIRQALILREEFIAAVAHELRSPLTVIRGRTELLLKETTNQPAFRETLQAILRHSDRITHLIDDMLTVLRVKPGVSDLLRTRFDLAELTRERARAVAGTSDRHQFRVETSGALIVDADRQLIGEVLNRLLENALRYSPEGGPIDVVAKRRNDDAVVSVTDHGLGIAPERQAHVFEPFYELAPAGTPGYVGIVTLGLYLSKQILEAHGGQIWFASKPGKGSTFSFSLPLARPEE